MTLEETNKGTAEKVIAALDAGGGYTTVSLGTLKEIVGVRRLGRYVLQDIKVWLRRQGLGYFPKELLDNNPEPRQDQILRLYRDERTDARAQIINAILDPSPDGDTVLIELANDASPVQKLSDLEERLERARAAVQDALAELDGPDGVQDGEPV